MTDALVKGWIGIAEQGIELLGRPAYGGVMAQRAVAAETLGVTRQTLRNYIDCLRFLKVVDAVRPEAGTALRTYAATVVAIYSRWYRYDPEGALDHAIAAQGQPATFIIAAEKAARRAVGPSSQSLLEVATKGVTATAGRAVCKALGGRTVPRLQDLRVDANVEPISVAMGAVQALVGDEIAIPVIELDRGTTGDGHRRGARSALARANLATSCNPLVLILLPDAEALDAYRAALPPVDKWLEGGSSLPMHRFAEGLGLVMAVEAAGFADAWSSN